jgi:hypothetical protein
MSSDNGIYILETKGPEFRVAYCSGIDNIYGNFNDDTHHWDGDPEMMLEYFAEAPVFTDVEKALDFATELSYNHDYLEYGVCLIREFMNQKFSDF